MLKKTFALCLSCLLLFTTSYNNALAIGQFEVSKIPLSHETSPEKQATLVAGALVGVAVGVAAVAVVGSFALGFYHGLVSTAGMIGNEEITNIESITYSTDNFSRFDN